MFRSADWCKCAVTPYGQGCGPKLDAGVSKVGNNNVVAWKLSGGFKNSFAINVIGTQALDLKLGGGCSLLSNALVLTIVQTDANGAWSDSDVLPLHNLQTFHQMLPFELRGQNIVLQATNGQKLVCTGF